MRRIKANQWIIGLGAASSGIFSSFIPLGQKACTGSCSVCGAICIPGILLAGWLLVKISYKKVKSWMNNRPGREAFREP